MRCALLAGLTALAACGPAASDDPTDDTDVVDTDETEDTDVVDTDETDETDAPEPDVDRDGTPASLDCDDDDPSSTTRATDADCDGYVTAIDCDDSDAASTIRPVDADCDGLTFDADCDDGDPTAPARADDRDCDGTPTADDCDDASAVSTVRATDADCDGSVTAQDCDDTDPDVFPGAPDVPYDGLDADCVGDSDYDADGDGHDAEDFGGDDCDDDSAAVSPDAAEVCNDVDDDCDGRPDLPTPGDAPIVYVDADFDGVGSAQIAGRACEPGPGTSSSADDCDDDDDRTFPGAGNVPCDGRDNDCDPATVPAVQGALLEGVPYPSLREALLDAADGDLVEVCEGVHTVSDVVVPVGVTVVGLGGMGGTVLDAANHGAVLRVIADSPVTLRDLTITRGGGFDDTNDVAGGGIYADAGVELWLEDVSLTNNRAGLGGGLFAGEGAAIDLVRTIVRDNRAPSTVSVAAAGGGVFLADGASLTLTASQITANTSRTCGGVRVGLGGRLEGDGASIVADNTADLLGGGVCASRGSATIERVDVLRNRASGPGGGLSITDATVTDVEVRANEAGLDGGGMTANGVVTLTRVELVNNRAGIDGGAVDAPLPGTTLTMDSCLVSGNAAQFFSADAGGVRLNRGRIVSIDTDWGAARVDNPPHDLAFVADGFTCDLVGAVSFTYEDSSGVKLCP